MKYNFGETGLIVGYIKELLHNFNLPAVPVFKDGDTPFEGRTYIKNNKVVKYVNGKFKELTFYTYNTPIVNLTRNLVINSSEYDRYTHTYLGDFLRFIRDYKGVDLMGMYNCFSGETPKRLEYSLNIDSENDSSSLEYIYYKTVTDDDGNEVRIKGKFVDSYEDVSTIDAKGNKETHKEWKKVFKSLEELGLSEDYTIKTGSNSVKFEVNTDNTGYNYYLIPVKFGQMYTIAINSEVKYEMACILYNDIFISATPESLVKESYKCFGGSRFNSPIVYSTDFSCAKDLWRKERDLRLLIKLPSEVDSSIVVLEGNYSPCSNVIDGSLVTNFIYNEENLPESYFSKNSLLALDDKNSYPFADKLIQYLLGHVINKTDPISDNIKRVQDIIYRDSNLEGYYGIWDKTLTSKVHDKLLMNDITKGTEEKHGNKILIREGNETREEVLTKRFIDTHEDLLGYVDKDVETLLRLI